MNLDDVKTMPSAALNPASPDWFPAPANAGWQASIKQRLISRQAAALLPVALLHVGALYWLSGFTQAAIVPPEVEAVSISLLTEAPAATPPQAKSIAPAPAKPAPPKPATRPSLPPVNSTNTPEPAAPNTVATNSSPAAAPATAAANPGSESPPASAPRFDANYLNNPAPRYPPLSRRFGEEGKVLLRVLVNADGQAQEIRLQGSSGSARLDEAALDAVRHWRFVPARQGDRPISGWVVVPINFRLDR